MISPSQNPLEPVLFSVFNAFGENYPSMQFTRLATRMSRGWKIADVRSAAHAAVPELLSAFLPYARVEIARHHSLGRAVVVATTTPFELVKPFADAIGCDDVIATAYGEDHGCFDGSIQGEFVWGKGKARSVAAWCERNGIDLGDCAAYSDSYYDVPLLSMVNEPWVINPDPRMMAVAALRRWPTRYFDSPAGVPQIAGIEPQRAVMTFARPELFPYAKFKMYGTKRVPRVGPAIVVGNHRSYFDPLAIGCTLAKAGRPVRFLGKKEVFDAPIVGDIARAMGGIRVDRATGSDAPLQQAEQALEAGELVALMPQGTIPRGREFFNPVLKGRFGAARLAHATRAPIIPIGLWGTEKVWPRSSKLPNIAGVLNPPTVTIAVGRPVELGYEDLESDTERIMSAIVDLLPPQARHWHQPTDEELLATLPSGSTLDDVTSEARRRPGTD